MATINLNLNIHDNDVVNININGKNVNEQDINVLHDKLKKGLIKKSNSMPNHFWYEVFIDFSETFDDGLYPLIKDLPYEAAFDLCWGYLQRRDDYYRSPNYYEGLNEMIKSAF